MDLSLEGVNFIKDGDISTEAVVRLLISQE